MYHAKQKAVFQLEAGFKLKLCRSILDPPHLGIECFIINLVKIKPTDHYKNHSYYYHLLLKYVFRVFPPPNGGLLKASIMKPNPMTCKGGPLNRLMGV